MDRKGSQVIDKLLIVGISVTALALVAYIIHLCFPK
jgi:hypothetical protein